MALTSYSANLITGGSSHTKGSYTQFVAATPYASSRLHLVVQSAGNASNPLLVDLATGAAGAETVIVPNLAYYTDSTFLVGAFTTITVDIPAGTRLAGRVQASLASTSFSVLILLEDRALAGLSAPVNYGAVTGTSRGTVIDPGATANTKGAYTQLTAATSVRIDAVVLCLTGGSVSGLAGFHTWNVDVAIGAAGSEVVVIADLVLVNNAGGSPVTVRPGIVLLPVSIPAATRLAVRCASTNNAAATRTVSVTLIGMQDAATGGSGGSASSVAYLG